MTTHEERSDMNTAELEPRYMLRTPIRGKTGAEIVGYQWVSHMEEGMFRDRRVSSWEDAQVSVPTGRKIVHLFWVRMPDTGEIILMGVGAAKKALGLAEAKLYSIAKSEAAAQRYWKDIWDREASKPYHGSAREARQAWTQVNWKALSSSFLSEEERNRKFDEASAKIKLLHRDGRWLLTSDQERIYELGLRGWEIVSGSARTESNPPELLDTPAMGVLGRVSGIFFNGHDEDDEDPTLKWWSSDLLHAAYFGALSAVKYDGLAFIVDANAHPDLMGKQGYEADGILEDICENSGAWVCAARNWEGEGWILFAPRGLDPDDQLLETLPIPDGELPSLIMPTRIQVNGQPLVVYHGTEIEA
jgi:hypothetical protein